MLNEQYFYGLLFCVHLPIVVIFLAKAIQGRWVSGSIFMHCAFTSYWAINAVLILLLMLDVNRPVPQSERVLLIIQSLLTLPLLAYAIPAMRETMGWPCIGAIQDNMAKQEQLRSQLEVKLNSNKDNYEKKLAALLRLVKKATRETRAQREFIEGKEGMETIKNWVEAQQTLLNEVNDKIQAELPLDEQQYA